MLLDLSDSRVFLIEVELDCRARAGQGQNTVRNYSLSESALGVDDEEEAVEEELGGLNVGVGKKLANYQPLLGEEQSDYSFVVERGAVHFCPPVPELVLAGWYFGEAEVAQLLKLQLQLQLHLCFRPDSDPDDFPLQLLAQPPHFCLHLLPSLVYFLERVEEAVVERTGTLARELLADLLRPLALLENAVVPQF